MSLSVVHRAAKPGKPNVTEVVAVDTAMGPDARWSRQYVPSVTKKLKYRSSPVKVDLCIVAIATVKTSLITDNGS